MPDSANGAFVDAPDRLRQQGAAVRIPFVHGCLLTTSSRVRGGLVCNLSVQGVYITLDEPLPEAGDPVHVLVQLPDQKPLLEADTIVTWQNRQPATNADSLPPGVGLRFRALAPEYRQRIVALVHYYLDVDDRSPLTSKAPHAGPERVAYLQRSRLTTRAGTVDGLICNLSRLGAYVAVRPLPAMGEAVRLAFVVSKEGVALDLEAAVVWRNADESARSNPLAPGCGMRFVSVSKENERRLRALVDGIAGTKA